MANVKAMHQSSLDGVEDMILLSQLHESSLLHNLRLRFMQDLIYVRDSLISLALFKPHRANLTGKPLITSYFHICSDLHWKHLGGCEPVQGPAGIV